MKTVLFNLAFILSFNLLAQSNLTVFNNGGQQFFVILNGIKQNSVPQTNVVVSGIKNGAYAMKVIFADGKTPDLNRRLFLEEPMDITLEVRFTKGKAALRYIVAVPISGSMSNGLVFRENDSFIYSDAPVVNSNTNPNWNNNQNTNLNGNVNTNQQTNWDNNTNNQQTTWNTNSNVNQNQQTNWNNNNQQTTTIQTNTTGQPVNGSVQINANFGTNGTNTQVNDQWNNNTNGNVNMNVNVGATGMNSTFVDPVTGETFNMNMNVNMGGVNTQQTSTQTTTVTTTTSGNWDNQNNQNWNSNTNQNNQNQNWNTNQNQNWNSNNNQNNQNGNTNQNQNWNSNTNQNNQNWNNTQQTTTTNSKFINCTNTIWNFDEFMADLKDQTFESGKIDLMKKDLIKTCVSFQQAKQMLELLTFEASRYEMAQYLYYRITDRQNADRGMLPLFTFDATKNNWRDFVRSNNQ